MRIVLGIGAIALALVGASYGAQQFHRQYYSNGSTVGHWHYHRPQQVYSIYYKYRPNPTINTYQHHVGYYYPNRTRHVYYYNPHTRRYWGRCPLDYSATNPYQILDYNARHENIADVDESKFQPLPATLNPPGQPQQVVQGPMPAIPGATDNEQMQPPPPPPAMPPAE